MFLSMKTAFRTGSWLAIATGILHTLGHFQDPTPETDRERVMLELMRGVAFDAGGVERTMWDILSGLSLSFTVLMLLMGIHGLRIARSGDASVLADTARIYAVTAAMLTGLGLLYFPTPAIACTGLMLAAYLVASLRRG
jgi:hypothetical protein